MKRISLPACGEQLAPAVPAPIPAPTQPAFPVAPAPTPVPATPTPGTQVNVDNEFWYGTISRSGTSIPGGMGFLQTGSSVTGILAFTNTSGEVVTSPRMTGTTKGYTLTISDTDAVGDMAIITGTFDQSQLNFSGTLTFIIDGERTVLGLAMSYSSQLDAQMQTQMQAQSVKTFKEIAEQFK